MLVLGLVLITLIAIVTLRHLDEFHLNSGPTFARVIAWIWVVAYFQAPFTLLTAIFIEERGRRHEPSGRPLTLWFRRPPCGLRPRLVHARVRTDSRYRHA